MQEIYEIRSLYFSKDDILNYWDLMVEKSISILVENLNSVVPTSQIFRALLKGGFKSKNTGKILRLQHKYSKSLS